MTEVTVNKYLQSTLKFNDDYFSYHNIKATKYHIFLTDNFKDFLIKHYDILNDNNFTALYLFVYYIVR